MYLSGLEGNKAAKRSLAAAKQAAKQAKRIAQREQRAAKQAAKRDKVLAARKGRKMTPIFTAGTPGLPVSRAAGVSAPEPVVVSGGGDGGAPVMSFADSAGNPVDVNAVPEEAAGEPGARTFPPGLWLVGLAVGAFLLLGRKAR